VAETDVQPSIGQGITSMLADPSIHVVETDAKSSTTEQTAQIDQAVEDGLDVMIVLPQSPDIIAPAIERAVTKGIRVIAINRAVMNPNVLYVGPDEAQVGELEARALLAVKPSGRFVVIKGTVSIPGLLRRQGMTRAGLPDVGQSSATLINVGETFTSWSDWFLAQVEMEEFLQRNGNKVDMVFVEDDGLAPYVVLALKERGLAGKVPVASAGGASPGLNYVALGYSVADVAVDPNEVGKVAGEAAVALCSDPSLQDVATSAGKPAPFTAPGSLTVPALLVKPIVFDRSNLRVALDRQFGLAVNVCRDVPPGSVDGC
jgi:D-xylose transport system substrate-binding protein